MRKVNDNLTLLGGGIGKLPLPLFALWAYRISSGLRAARKMPS